MCRFTIDPDEVDEDNKLMFEIFGGYMYLNLSVARLMGARSSGMTPEMVDMGFFGDSLRYLLTIRVKKTMTLKSVLV